MLDLQEVCQGHEVQFFAITSFDGKCQNLQISPTHFCASSYSFRDIKIFPFTFKQ